MKSRDIFTLGLALIAGLAVQAYSGTVVLSTTTYAGASGAVGTESQPISLPGAGAYIFDMVAESSGTADTWGLALYMQQRGVSAGNAYYTIYNSTFTTCNSNCTKLVIPDVYLGGDVRAAWAVTSGSVTIRITARKVTP